MEKSIRNMNECCSQIMWSTLTKSFKHYYHVDTNISLHAGVKRRVMEVYHIFLRLWWRKKESAEIVSDLTRFLEKCNLQKYPLFLSQYCEYELRSLRSQLSFSFMNLAKALYKHLYFAYVFTSEINLSAVKVNFNRLL